MALVQPPVLDHGQPQAVHFVQTQVEGTDGALEHAGVGDIEIEAFFLDQASCTLGLGDASGGEVNVGPAGETVF